MMETLKGVGLSFYSGVFYHRLARARAGIGMSYITVLTVLLTIVVLVLVKLLLPQLLAALPSPQQMPQITIQNNTLSIDKPSPYILTMPSNTQGMNIVFDTNYKIGELSALQDYMTKNHAFILVTARQTVVDSEQWAPNGKLEITPIHQNDITITHEDWQKFSDAILHFSIGPVAAAVFVALILFNLIATVISAVGVMVTGLITGVALEFPAAMRFSAALRIPVYLFPVLFLTLGLGPARGFVNWALWLLYIVFAVLSVRAGDRASHGH